MKRQPFVAERLYTPGEVAAMFNVHPRTVNRWVAAEKLRSWRTIGGHLRIPESEVRRFLDAQRGAV